ncbi:hypothetical protein [Actinacidiphila acididurans]|uniref:Uncharacterized protein n=1 Tax=Actinacidiphila acididurans TaxID=2784346 RepID=A0ABS2TSG7_9ACTN|nr:hypothetical protein [Actinacidiphila acididurans]MBM9506280.1 hypothetical protein [Actinacidiphila acididurans]
MYAQRVRLFLSFIRLLDVMAAEPAVQLEYLRLKNFPSPESAMVEFFEDLEGFQAFFGDMLDAGTFGAGEQELFERLLRLGDAIDSQPDSCTRGAILYGRQWNDVRDTALLLKLSVSSKPVPTPLYDGDVDAH